MKSISAAEANRQFSTLLRKVSHGATITVTSRGRPVATLSPAETGMAERQAARQVLLARLGKQAKAAACNWTRDELYGG